MNEGRNDEGMEMKRAEALAEARGILRSSLE